MLALFVLAISAHAQNLGAFESQSDVGTLLHEGSAEFDAASGTYTLTGSGENMWAAEDDFHYVWKKVSGDVSLTADIAFPSATGNAHKKGALMIRRTLDADSDYVDASLHLSGLTSIQSRQRKGDITREVQSYIASPRRLRLIKTGRNVFLYVAGEDGVFHLSGGSMQFAIAGPFYIGLAACAHDKDAVEKVVFSNVELALLPPSNGKPVQYSTLELQTSDRRAIWVEPGRFEAPHWSPDGKVVYFTRGGRLAKIPAAGGVAPEFIATGSLTHIDSHTGLSPDGFTMAVTDAGRIYTLPAGGGAPQLLTKESPSYFCSWSPDGKNILFTGKRHGSKALLSMAAEGGDETAIPIDGAFDNPIWSPDGKSLWFDAVRGPLQAMNQIWRALPDGAQPEPVTTDNFINSTPQPSPDGRQLAFLSQNGSDLFLRSLSLTTEAIRILAIFPDVQGSLAASPWSPDSKSLAFVSYQQAPE